MTQNRWYLAMMGSCVTLVILAWTVVRIFSLTAGIVMPAVALVIPPIAVAGFCCQLARENEYAALRNHVSFDATALARNVLVDRMPSLWRSPAASTSYMWPPSPLRSCWPEPAWL
jgi:hypothetical protein